MICQSKYTFKQELPPLVNYVNLKKSTESYKSFFMSTKINNLLNGEYVLNLIGTLDNSCHCHCCNKRCIYKLLLKLYYI